MRDLNAKSLAEYIPIMQALYLLSILSEPRFGITEFSPLIPWGHEWAGRISVRELSQTVVQTAVKFGYIESLYPHQCLENA